MTSKLIKRAEKLYDGEKYQEAIDLLLDKPSKKDKQNPDYWLWLGWCYYHENFEDNKKKIIESLTKGIKLYEENPKPFTDLKEDIKESKNLIVEAYAKIGLDDINNKKTVEKCCEYILNHVDDCSSFYSFAQTGYFLSLAMCLGYSDNNEIDTALELLEKAGDLFDRNVQINRIEFELRQNFAFSLKGNQCIEEGDFNNAKVYVEKILASENKIPDDGWFIDLSNIGMFLAGCHINRHFMNLNEDISSIASVYLHECLKNDEKYFQDGGNLGLGLLNFENEKVAWNYFSKISKSNKEINDLRIFFKVIIKLRGKPKDAIKELKSLNNSEVIPKVVVDLFLGAMYFEDNKDEKGTEILNSLSKSEFTGGLITSLPMYDLICCIYLKEEGALEHLKVWTQKYPDSPQYRALYGNGLWEHDYHIEAKFQLERAWELEKNIFTLIPLLKIYTYLGEYKEIESLRTELDNLIETKGIGQNFLAYLNLFKAIKDKKWSMANALAKKISDATDVYINKHLFPMLENLPREYCRSNNRAHFIDMLEGIILIIKKEYGKARNIFQKKENVISLWGMMKVYDAEGKTIEAEGFKQRLEEEVKKKQEDDDTNEIVKQILENQQIFIPHLMEIASSLPGKKGNSKPHVTKFDGLIIVLKNTLGNDRIKFCLTSENEKSDPIQIANTAMSFLLFLCYERSNEQEDWLDNPKIGKRMEIYADILSKLKVDDRYVDEMDGKVENFNGWIWDFENKYRKKIVSEIKDEFSRIINGKLILCHPYKSNKKGRYYLNPTIQKITIN